MNNISNLTASVTAILKNNNLNEFSLGDIDELSDPTYIIWWDNHGTPYEDPVIKVTSNGDGLSFEVEARDFDNTITVRDCDIDRLEWWQGIHANLLEVLQRDGVCRCPACGKPLKDQHKYCSENCRKFATPPPTAQSIAKLANRHIRQLIGQIAGTDRKLEKELIKTHIITL